MAGHTFNHTKTSPLVTLKISLRASASASPDQARGPGQEVGIDRLYDPADAARIIEPRLAGAPHRSGGIDAERGASRSALPTDAPTISTGRRIDQSTPAGVRLQWRSWLSVEPL
jgi:hypothetical protein